MGEIWIKSYVTWFTKLDLQGVGYILCDPEILTIDRRVETFQQMKYNDLCKLINVMESAEHLTLKNSKINSFREDGEVSKAK